MFVIIQPVKRNWVNYDTCKFYGAFYLATTEIHCLEKTLRKA